MAEGLGRYPQQCCRLTPHRTSTLRQEHVKRNIKRWHWERRIYNNIERVETPARILHVQAG